MTSQSSQAKDLLKQLNNALVGKSIYDLRQIGREVGVFRPTDQKKEDLIANILLIADGSREPIIRNKKGAPPKSVQYDRTLVDLIWQCRNYILGNVQTLPQVTPTQDPVKKDDFLYLMVASPNPYGEPTEINGIFCDDKVWEFKSGSTKSFQRFTYVHPDFIKQYHLQNGDRVYCRATEQKVGNQVSHIISSDGGEHITANFDELIHVYPHEQWVTGNGSIQRYIDLVAPIAKGQRCLWVAPPRSGITTLIEQVANQLSQQPNCQTILLMPNARPEEVNALRQNMPQTHIFASALTATSDVTIRMSELALLRAKRLVEAGKDVVLFVDNLSRLCTVYQSKEMRDIRKGFDISAITACRQLLSSAVCTQGEGSLTVIGAVLQTEHYWDNMLQDELTSVASHVLLLQRGEAPVVDVDNSYTRHDEYILSEQQKKASMQFKTLSQNERQALMQKTENNDQLCQLLLKGSI